VANCRSVLCVERFVKWSDGTTTCEVHYYVSSLDFAKWEPMDVLALVRNHWQVENCLHLIKDRWWDDDKHYLKRPGLGEVWECLLNRSLGMLRLLGERGASLTELAERISFHPRKYLKQLGFLNYQKK